MQQVRPEDQPDRAAVREIPRNEAGDIIGKNGRPIKADGRAAKRLVAEHRAAVIARGDAIPAGPALPANARALAGAERDGPLFIAGALRIQKFTPAVPPRDLATFSRQIAGAVSEVQAPVSAILTFKHPERGFIGRSIKFMADKSPRFIQAELEKLAYGAPSHGSDVVPDGFPLDTTSFAVGYTPARVGAGLKFTGISKRASPPNPWFTLVDTDTKRDGNCLLTVLRVVARLEGASDIREKAQTIRARYAIPDGPIEASEFTIDALAKHFGLRVSVIIGVDAPADTARTYNDDPARQREKNRCITVAAPIVIATGGDEGAPLCRLWLSDNHYEYIQADINLPWETCRVTGDLLTPEIKELNPKHLKERQRQRAIAQGRQWYGELLRDGSEKKKTKIKHRRVIVIDYETTYSPLGGLSPYSLGYLVFDPDTPELAEGDFTGEIAACVSESTSATSPREVSRGLIELLLSAPEDTQYTIVTFNGTSFDNFILCSEALEHNLLVGHSPIFVTSAGIRGFVMSGRHTCLDLARIITGSLKTACKDFGTMPKKVDGFCHALPQAAKDKGCLAEWIAENREKLTEYQKFDVLATASLFVKLRTVTKQITGVDILAEGAPRTAGGIAWQFMNEKCNIPQAVKSEELDKWIRSGITGGRVQVYGEKVVRDKELRMSDFVSLYPTAMCARDNVASIFPEEFCFGRYPNAGDSEGTPVKHLMPGCVGLYNVTIHRQPVPNVLPLRGKEDDEPLDWAYRGEFDTVCTHIDIHLIREKCGEDAVTVHSGRVWGTPKESGALFRNFIDPLIDIKNQQDEYCRTRDPRYNSALRAFVKLLMNAASGKCAQRNFDDVAELATGTFRQLQAASTMSKDAPIEYWPLSGETCLVVGKKPAGNVYNQRFAKPSVLAVLIYSYSRALVYRTLCQHNILYSDTDSGLFLKEDYDRLCEQFPHLIVKKGEQKQLGMLEEELGPHTTATAFLIAPKDYGIFLRGADGELITGDQHGKQKIKGVNQNRDRLIADEATLGELRKHTDSEKMRVMTDAELDAMSLAEIGHEYSDEALRKQAGSEKLRPRFSAPLSDINTCYEFFEQRAAGAKQRVLCSQLERYTKGTGAQAAQGDSFQLTQRFMIKRL